MILNLIKTATVFTFLFLFSISYAQTLPNIKFVFHNRTTNEFQPVIKVYLEIDNEVFYIKREYVESINPVVFNKDNELAGCSGWYSGSGINYWVTSNNEGLIIYREDIGEGIDDVQSKIIKRINFSKLTNGDKLKMSIRMKKDTATSSSQNYGFIAGKWKVHAKSSSTFFYYKYVIIDNTTIQGQWFGNNSFTKGGQKRMYYIVKNELLDDDGNKIMIKLIDDNKFTISNYIYERVY